MLDRSHRTVCPGVFAEGAAAIWCESLESIGRDTSYGHEPIIPPQYRDIESTAHGHKKLPGTWGRHEIFSSPATFSRLREYLSRFCAAIPCGWLDTSFWKCSNFSRTGLCLVSRPLRVFSLLPKRDVVPRSRVSGITLVSPPQGIKGNAKTPKQCHCRIDQLGKKH